MKMAVSETAKLTEGVLENSLGIPPTGICSYTPEGTEPEEAPPPPFPLLEFARHNAKDIGGIFRGLYVQERKKLEKNFVLYGSNANPKYWEKLVLEFPKRGVNIADVMNVAADRCTLYPWPVALLSPHFAPEAESCTRGAERRAMCRGSLKDNMTYLAQGLAASRPAEQILLEGNSSESLTMAPFIWCAAAHFGLAGMMGTYKYRAQTLWDLLNLPNRCQVLWESFQKEVELLLPESLRSLSIPEERTFGWHLQQCTEHMRQTAALAPKKPELEVRLQQQVRAPAPLEMDEHVAALFTKAANMLEQRQAQVATAPAPSLVA